MRRNYLPRMGNILRISRVIAALGFDEQTVAVVHIHSENAVVELVVAVHKRLVLCDNILVVQWSGNEPCERCGGHF